MTERIYAEHANGYSGVLYGKSSMSIYYEGREILHSGSRTPQTYAQLMDALETMPELMEMLRRENP